MNWRSMAKSSAGVAWLHDRGTPVIVIAGYGDLRDRLKKISAILHKPFTASALLTTLRLVMDRDRTL